jgi:hypothetical protein
VNFLVHLTLISRRWRVFVDRDKGQEEHGANINVLCQGREIVGGAWGEEMMERPLTGVIELPNRPFRAEAFFTRQSVSAVRALGL